MTNITVIKKTMIGMALLVICQQTQATLFSRLGGAALYDDVLNITWIADANLAVTEHFGLTLSTNVSSNAANTIGSTGRMTWDNAKEWIAGMNNDSYLGYSDWRLPESNPINSNNYVNSQNNTGSTDHGYNLSRPGTLYAGSTQNEMAHLFYNTLGNVSDFDTSGVNQDDCPGISSCLVQTGLFTNIQDNYYWSGSEFLVTTAWRFNFYDGFHGERNKSNTHYAMAVRDGDVAPVPLPGAIVLLISALGWLLYPSSVRPKQHDKFSC